MFELTDRVVLVTGGSRGIGRAIALELGRAGAAVVVDRDAAGDTVNQLRNLGVDALALAADVRRAADVDQLVTEAHRWQGRLHGLVTSAGVFRGDAMEEVGREEWDAVVQTDLEGTFRTIRAAAPYLALEPHAAVVTLSSILGAHAASGGAPYQASKAGIEQLTRALALELAPEVRVNCVAPGFIRTDMNRGGWTDADFAARVERGTLLGRWGQPEDIAGAARFLLSRESEAITGAVLPVDGGAALW
jgi:3-oxoacyl-[acyl-carrier protein] reductase